MSGFQRSAFQVDAFQVTALVEAFQCDAFQSNAFQLGTCYFIEVDWNNDGDYGDTGENISTYVTYAEWHRGRDYASQLTGRASAGRFTAELLNTDGRFSSFNSASPMYGNILPGRPVRIRVSGSVLATLWTGYLDRIEPHVQRGALPRATLYASGPLSRLTAPNVPIPVQANRLTGTAIADVLNAAEWSATLRALDAGQTTITTMAFAQTDALSALRDIEATEFGFLSESSSGEIVFEDRYHRVEAPHTTSQATFTDAAGGARRYQAIQQEDPLQTVFNRVEATIQRYTIGALATVWTFPETGANSPALGAGESRTFIATYPTPDAATAASHIDAWTTPVATTDVHLSDSTTDTNNLIASLTIAASVKNATTMEIVLTNTHASTVGYVTLLQARGTPATKNDPVVVVGDDATSQTAYGLRVYPIPGTLIPTSDGGQQYADYVKTLYKDARPIVSIEVLANRDELHHDEVIEREISDRVTITATGTQTQLGISGDFFIEAMHHRLELGNPPIHTVTWECSDAAGFGGWWVLGVSTLGVTTRLIY